MEYKEDEYLMLSGIQHFKFCRRQWALIHIEQEWGENVHTVIGIAGGKVGTVIGTCVASKFAHSETTGIVAGTVMGIPIGLIITTWGDMKFDKWYEEQKEQWEEKKEREQEINPYVILE